IIIYSLKCIHPPINFVFNHTTTTDIYTLSLHDALPISSEWNSAIADSTYTSDTVYQQNMANPVAPKALVPTVTTCPANVPANARSEEHTSELQSRENLVCRLLLEKKKQKNNKEETLPND